MYFFDVLSDFLLLEEDEEDEELEILNPTIEDKH